MTAFVEAHEIQLSFDFQAVMKSRKPRVSGRKRHSINRKTTALDLLEHEEWTGDDIALLHMKLLERSIDDLRNNRIKVREKAEIMEWIKEEKMPGQRARPFSFIKCCEYSGLDPDEMRDQLMDYLAHYFNKGEFVPAREDEFGCITHATATH